MVDFIPTQTFTFDLQQGEQQNFFIWPSADIQKIRGVFYIDHDINPEQVNGQGLFLGCQVNGVMQKTFINQRLGVFNIIPKIQPTNIKIIVKSQQKPLNVYLSYQLRKKIQKSQIPQNLNQNVPTKQEQELIQKKGKLQQVIDKFKKVQMTVQGQQNSLRMIVKYINKHGKKLQGDLKYAKARVIIETLIVILSGLFGIWLLKKQMNKGYQLLV